MSVSCVCTVNMINVSVLLIGVTSHAHSECIFTRIAYTTYTKVVFLSSLLVLRCQSLSLHDVIIRLGA